MLLQCSGYKAGARFIVCMRWLSAYIFRYLYTWLVEEAHRIVVLYGFLLMAPTGSPVDDGGACTLC